MRFIDEQDFDPEDGKYKISLLNRCGSSIDFIVEDGKGGCPYCDQIGRFFLRGCFEDAMVKNEGVIEPVYVSDSGRRIYPSGVEAVDGIFRDEVGMEGFDYLPDSTPEQQQKAFKDVLSCFVDATRFLDTSRFRQLNNCVFSVGTRCAGSEKWIRYIPEDGDYWDYFNDLKQKMIAMNNELAKKELRPNIEQRKQEIRARLEQSNDKKYGVAAADRIAEAMISGVIEDPVTPKRGNRIAANVERKIIADKIVDKIKKGR